MCKAPIRSIKMFVALGNSRSQAEPERYQGPGTVAPRLMREVERSHQEVIQYSILYSGLIKLHFIFSRPVQML